MCRRRVGVRRPWSAVLRWPQRAALPWTTDEFAGTRSTTPSAATMTEPVLVPVVTRLDEELVLERN